MQLYDRLFCDRCQSYVGQLVGGMASDHYLAHMPGCICPDCQEREVSHVKDQQALLTDKAA